MKFILICLLISLPTHAVLAQSKKNPVPILLKLPLTQVNALKPFGGNAIITDIVSSTLGFQGIPDTLARYVIRSAPSLHEQDLYEQHQQGLISKQRWGLLSKQLDTTKLSKTPLRHRIYVLAGLTKAGQRMLIVDQNNNQNFADDRVLVYPPLTGIGRRNGRYEASLAAIVDTLPVITVQTEVYDGHQKRSKAWSIRPNPYNQVELYADTTLADLHAEFQACCHQEGIYKAGEVNYRLALSNQNVSPVYLPAEVKIKVASGKEDFRADEEAFPAYQIGQSIRLGQSVFRLLGVTYLGDTLLLSPLPTAERDEGTRPGQYAPAFTLLDLRGNPLSSRSLREGYVILDFWGSWCGPCIELIPELKRLQTRYEGHSQVKLISIAREDTDRLDALKKLVRKYAMNWPQVVERPATASKYRILDRYQITSFPTTMLLSPSGRILHRGSGRAALEELSKLLDEALSPAKK